MEVKGITIMVDNREAVKMLDAMVYAKVAKKKDVRKVVREELRPVRKQVVSAASAVMKRDPRRAKNAVKTVTYRDANGGNINLFLRKGRKPKLKEWNPVRGGVSGIRRNRKRSKRTVQMDAYYGADRGFILSWLNDGAGPRFAYTRTPGGKYAHRGIIKAKNFFKIAESNMNTAAKRVSVRIVKLLEEVAGEY